MEKREIYIGAGVVGLAAVVAFLHNRNAASSGGSTSGGVTDIAGGFQTAGTVYVPTSSYNIQYNVTSGDNSPVSTTGTFGGAAPVTVSSPAPSPVMPAPSPAPSPVVLPPAPIPAPPIITTGSGSTVNPVIKPPITQPRPAPAPTHAAPPVQTTPVKVAAPVAMGSMHYATPAGGWNGNSVTDYIKEHGGYSDFASRAKLAGEMGIQGYTGSAAQNATMLQKLKAHYN